MHKKVQTPPSNPVTNKQKHEAKTKRLNALQWLAQQFPEAFDNRLRIRPLKVGMMQDVLAHVDAFTKAGFSKTKIREAIVLFARRVDYLVCLKAGEARIDLFGKPAGTVSDTEALKAKNKIKKRIEKAVKHIHQNHAAKQPAYTAPSSRQRPSITIKSRTRRSFDPKIIKKLEQELSLPSE